jgi:hypothetical protein
MSVLEMDPSKWPAPARELFDSAAARRKAERVAFGGPYIALYNHPELARRIEEAGFISSSKAYCHDRSTNSSCSPWRMRRGQGSCGGTTSSTRSRPASRTRSSTQWAPDGPKRCLSPTRSFPRSSLPRWRGGPFPTCCKRAPQRNGAPRALSRSSSSADSTRCSPPLTKASQATRTETSIGRGAGCADGRRQAHTLSTTPWEASEPLAAKASGRVMFLSSG